MEEWIFGSLLCLIASAISNLGLTFIKVSHIDLEASTKNIMSVKNLPFHPTWEFAFIVFVIGQVLNMMAMAYCSPALSAVLGSFSLITNGFFSSIFLKETTTRRYMFSCVFIVVGCAMVIMYSSHSEQNFDLDALLFLLWQPVFLVFISIVSVAFIVAATMLLLIPKSAVLATLVSAFLSCYSVLLAKSTMQLLKETFLDGKNQFTNVASFMISIAFLCAAISSVFFLNMAIANGDNLFVVPFYFVCATLLQIGGGVVYFQEYLMFDIPCLIFMPLGICLTIFGVIYAQAKEHPDKEDIHSMDISRLPEAQRLTIRASALGEDRTPDCQDTKLKEKDIEAVMKRRQSFQDASIIFAPAAVVATGSHRRSSTNIEPGSGLLFGGRKSQSYQGSQEMAEVF